MRSTSLPPRLVILDFDGTLADSLPWLLGTFDDTAARFGLNRLTADAIHELRGEETRAALRALGVPRWRMPAIAAHLRQRAAEAPPPPLFDGIADMLRRLAAAGIRLGIASSNTETQIRRTLGDDLAELVQHYAAEASLFGKATRFRRILRVAAVPAANALAIGDEPRDIEAARAAGIATGAVAWGFSRPATLQALGPDAFFTTPAEIVGYCGA